MFRGKKKKRKCFKTDNSLYHQKKTNKQTNKQTKNKQTKPKKKKPGNLPVCLTNNDPWLPNMVANKQPTNELRTM